VTTQQQALTTLNRWMQQRGLDVPVSIGDAWGIEAFRKGFVFRPSGGARSNRLYLVIGDEVTPFTPSSTTLRDTYAAAIAHKNHAQ
jgi:hypothetical protein